LNLTVAISRETGSRGGTIARRVGRKLGWQVYHQELLEYLAQEKHLSRDLFDVLDDAAAQWIEGRLQTLLKRQTLSQNANVIEVARVILAIGARGAAILLGRGAGCILPAETTVNVRVVAPLSDRISYLSQFERLTLEEAAEQVRQRDRQRETFMETHFHRTPTDVHQYDLVMNSSHLGEELSAQLIVQAVRAKLKARGDDVGPAAAFGPEALA
jgi:cytidylate kinase